MIRFDQNCRIVMFIQVIFIANPGNLKIQGGPPPDIMNEVLSPVTGVKTPISGVVTLLVTGRVRAHLVVIASRISRPSRIIALILNLAEHGRHPSIFILQTGHVT